MTAPTDERAAFTRWYESAKGVGLPGLLRPDQRETAWAAWQAALSAQPVGASTAQTESRIARAGRRAMQAMDQRRKTESAGELGMTPEAKALIRQFHDGTARKDWEAWGLDMIAMLRAHLPLRLYVQACIEEAQDAAPPSSTPEPLTDERIVAEAYKHADTQTDARGRTSFEFDSHGLISYVRALASTDGARPDVVTFGFGMPPGSLHKTEGDAPE